MVELERHDVDVLVIGAGGAGLRAAVEASAAGARTAVICKSLLGKAHTVMAEGGVAAALGNVWPEDNWKVHFRDTMRGGKMLNNWRMAQLHAQEAPDRVIEVFMECKIIRLLHDANGAVNGAVGLWRETGKFVVFGAKSVILASG